MATWRTFGRDVRRAFGREPSAVPIQVDDHGGDTASAPPKDAGVAANATLSDSAPSP
ncbi:hypothetical protein PUR71_18750 [Streptomyces sp. SP17BM10]|uniref:hypothetical protein n=1 Tax=Streptomyces sp. SP17BM10 TaxID=3002530 RepID=UPI002E7A318C|nr:hypothetical protein [Streptomyces sp. SP17BM10]MEE1784933.1 hypothetical protein [Streptomyces sp. SP17BM10]